MDSTRPLSLSFRGWFLCLQRLSFRWRFMDEEWDSVFDNSIRHHDSIFAMYLMCRSWIHLRYRFHMSSVTQFSLTISRSIGLCFQWRFRDQQWHSVFDNSMRQLWLYFCHLFDMSVMNSFTLSIQYASCPSVFSDDFKVYETQFALTIYGSAVT